MALSFDRPPCQSHQAVRLVVPCFRGCKCMSKIKWSKTFEVDRVDRLAETLAGMVPCMPICHAQSHAHQHNLPRSTTMLNNFLAFALTGATEQYASLYCYVPEEKKGGSCRRSWHPIQPSYKKQDTVFDVAPTDTSATFQQVSHTSDQYALSLPRWKRLPAAVTHSASVLHAWRLCMTVLPCCA